jgi:large subunit ribosomal protein L19
MNNTKSFIENELRSDLPENRVGDTIKIYYKFTEKGKERIQPFEGIIIAKKGSDISETMTIRGSVSGVMMEKIIPVNSPNIEKIEIVKKGKVRRAKLYYLRTAIGKRLRLKRRLNKQVVSNDNSDEDNDLKTEENVPQEQDLK